jgi:glyoxylase-like metal-dependent hydrolase (beta-lactamase superfamily II)
MRMESMIIPVNLDGLLGYGVNCYLIRIETGFILIDTGISPMRAELVRELDRAGCEPGNLKLIVLTHGHGDHIGNSVYLRDVYGAKIAMHRGDSMMVERGSVETGFIGRMVLPLIVFVAGIGKSECFEPDVYLEEGQGLSEYGFDAKVLHLPGHSDGSIGILIPGGDLFCGDIFVNKSKPARHSIVTDAAAFDASVARLKTLDLRMVYPGHGKPFPMSRIS